MKNEKTFLKVTSVIFRLYTNLLRSNLNKQCKNVNVTRIVTNYKIKKALKLLKRKMKMLLTSIKQIPYI